MADKIYDIQLKTSGGVKSFVNTGDKRLTLINAVRLIYAMLHGSLYKAGSSYFQVQDTLVAASATCTAATVVAGNTVTIAGTALTATQRRATGTLTAATAIAGNTCVVNGVTFTGTAGAVVLGEATFSIDTGNTATATSLAAQINGYADRRISGIVAAKSAAAVVTVYAITQGTAGNSVTLVGTATTLEASAATLTGGAAIANNTFDFAGTNATTANALAAAINASTTAAVKRVTAVSDGVDVVTITAKVAGVAGNAITLTSSGATLTVTGAGFLASGSASEPTRWTF